MTKIAKTDARLADHATPEQYRILREKGTEPAFTGSYCDDHTTGVVDRIPLGTNPNGIFLRTVT